MSKREDGGSAFPVQAWDGPNEQMLWPETGMTLRDYFAGQALMGSLAFPGPVNGSRDKSEKAVAEAAYCYADAMLAERSK